MSSVTRRIDEITQPKGGYLSPNDFNYIQRDDGLKLGDENISPSVIGTVVDYLTRSILNSIYKPDKKFVHCVAEAFVISLEGYLRRARELGAEAIKNDKRNNVEIFQLLECIKGLDDNSIIAACKAVTYDVWFRNPSHAMKALDADNTLPDKQTISNIRIMVERCLSFFEEYGPVISNGFTFEKGGYTKVVDSGDGDYLTEDTMWDFKVTKNKVTSKHTLQLLMYWIMGKHSKQKIFKNINIIGIFNPRLNVVYTYEMNKFSKEYIKDIEKNIICYK